MMSNRSHLVTLREFQYSTCDINTLRVWHEIPDIREITNENLLNLENTSVLLNDTFRMYMIELDNINVGCLNLNLNKQRKSAEIGIMIGEKQMRRSGIATAALNLTLNDASMHCHLDYYFAYVYHNNFAAKKLFENAGFHSIGSVKFNGRLAHHYRRRLIC